MTALDHRSVTARRLAPIAALAAILVSACGGGSTTGGPGIAEGPPIRGHGVLFSLLTLGDESMTVDAPGADSAPDLDLLRPRKSGPGDFAALPSLIVTPPTVVRYTIPETHPRAVLRYAVAVHHTGFRGEGSVRFKGRFDGEPIFEHELDCSSTVDKEDRHWHRHEVPLPHGGELELEAVYAGDQSRAPLAGFGLLRVAVPFAVPRTLATEEHPNVLLVLIDTLRADRLSSYGNPAEVSPVMDALADRGTRFERAFASAPWTLPGTASVLTGKSPPEHGIGSGAYFLVDEIDTLAEVMQRAGVTTGAFSCNPLVSGSRNFDQGFETFTDYRWARTSVITRDVLGWLEAHARERFFLYLHLVDPHFPYEPTEESHEQIVPPPPDGFLAGDLRTVLGAYYGEGVFDRERLESSTKHQLKLYDAEVRDVDRALGEVLARLEALGLTDRTVVCVTSDHGEEFLEHGWAGHNRQLYDESVHVPLILAGPGVEEGKVVPVDVENRHIAPTLLHLAHVVPSARMRGPNLLDDGDLEALEGEGIFLTAENALRADFETRTMDEIGRTYSLIDGEWRLVTSRTPDASQARIESLYDLSVDPECLVDVAGENPDRVLVMRDRIQRWLTSGQRRRPRMMPAAEETMELLRSLGYIGGDGE